MMVLKCDLNSFLYIFALMFVLSSVIAFTSLGLIYAVPTVNTFFGTYGNGNGQFGTPHDITFDSSGNIYVSDTANNRIEKFSSSGNLISAIGKSGKKDGEFTFPKGIAIDNQGNLYVVDQSNNRIQKFDSAEKFKLSFGKSGTQDGRFQKPRDIAIDSSGNLFVTDQLNNRIQKFDSAGKFISKFGTTGVGDGQFKQPLGITIDKNNRIYVVDSQNNRYQVFSSSGTHLLTVGRLGVANGQFDTPEDITVDTNGNVYVSDTGNNRIQKFDSNGNFIYSFGQHGTTLGTFAEPRGLIIIQNTLYAVDSVNNRIQIISNLDYVPDITPPTITVPTNITVDASSYSGSAVVYSSTANDETDGMLSVSCSPSSGSTFPQGTTIVSCMATDQSGNVATKSFTIIVNDYVMPSENTIHLTESNNQATITSDSSVSQVLMDYDIKGTLVFSPVSDNQITTPDNALNISIAQLSGNPIELTMAAKSTISNLQFSGEIHLFDGNVSSCPKDITKETETLQSCIDVGVSGSSISISPPIRILLPNQGNFIPYYAIKDNEERTIITTMCTDDTLNSISAQIGGTAQPDTCFIKIGQDMIIWSSHFTSFGTLTASTESIQSNSSTSSNNRHPPKIYGIGLYKILTNSEQDTEIESQKFENYFPYSMHSYISDSLNYGEKFVKIGQFFPLKGYSTEVLPVIAEKGDHVQIQVRLYDEYRGFNIEHVALYFTDKESTDIEKLNTFVSYEKDSQIKISDPTGIFGNVQVGTSPEFDAYWAIFDIQFANPMSTNDILIETWNESHFPSYAKAVNSIELYNPLLHPFEDKLVLKTVEIHIPSIHTNPQCAPKKTCFEPSEATVLTGGIVSWINKDASFVHAITSGKQDYGPDNRFNGFLRPGNTYEFQFNQLGDYPYYCAIHPWAAGMIHVVTKETQSTFDKTQDVTSGSNISGKVSIPESIPNPIRVESIESGINTSIEAGKTIPLKTKNLSVEISGYVGKNPVSRDVQITVIRPDNTEDKFNVIVNADGDYFIPTKLNSKWQSGHYEVIATYNNVQIGNIPFMIKSADEHGFGGILPTPSTLTLVSLENYVNLNISEKQLDENLSKLGWSDSKIMDFKDRLRDMFLVVSPLQQTNSGVPSENVSCNVGLQLVITKDGLSKCVKIDSVDKLLDRGLVDKIIENKIL